MNHGTKWWTEIANSIYHDSRCVSTIETDCAQQKFTGVFVNLIKLGRRLVVCACTTPSTNINCSLQQDTKRMCGPDGWNLSAISIFTCLLGPWHLTASGLSLLRDINLSPPILLRHYNLPYWSNPPFLIFDIRAHVKNQKWWVRPVWQWTLRTAAIWFVTAGVERVNTVIKTDWLLPWCVCRHGNLSFQLFITVQVLHHVISKFKFKFKLFNAYIESDQREETITV